MIITVLGAGQMSYAICSDLLRNCSKLKKLHIVDTKPNALKSIELFLDSRKVRTHKMSILDNSLKSLIKKSSCVIGATSYKHNWYLTQLCVEYNINFCDLGGNNDIVSRQHSLNSQNLKCSIVPDCGLAPGLINIAASYYTFNKHVRDLKLYVGGLPQKSHNFLNYEVSFSVDGLINEYCELCIIKQNGIIMEVPALSSIEPIKIPTIPMMLEAFHTSGGISTMPLTMSHVDNIIYKTIRHAGHCNIMQLLKDTGAFHSDRRKVTSNVLSNLCYPYNKDMVLIKIIVDNNKYWTICFADSYFSAMQKMTGFSISIIAQMAANNILPKGVLYQELDIPQIEFMTELDKRDIIFSKYI